MVAVALVVVAVGAAAAPAAADEQPSILKAYGLDWIERVRDDAWPQPKAQRPVICLLDTGVAVTPDTPADDPNGPIVARLAIDGGSGLPQGSTFEHLHGTTMASVIAAPRNDWGTVGVFPQARIVSVRVTVDQATYITPADMEVGTRACRKWTLGAGLRLGAVVMAESRYDQRESDQSWWQTAADLAAYSNGIFVAAAGNDSNAQGLPPATAINVLTVAAGDESGALCGFAKAEPLQGLRGPGCRTSATEDVAGLPTGSSAATAVVGATAAALASLLPTLSASELSTLVRGSSVGDRVFSGAALGTRFADSLVASPVVSTAPQTLTAATSVGAGGVTVGSTKTSPATPRATLWRPKVVAALKGRRLYIRRIDHNGGTLWIQVRGSRTGAHMIRGSRGSFVVARAARQLTVWASSMDAGAWRSLSSSVKVKR